MRSFKSRVFNRIFQVGKTLLEFKYKHLTNHFLFYVLKLKIPPVKFKNNIAFLRVGYNNWRKICQFNARAFFEREAPFYLFFFRIREQRHFHFLLLMKAALPKHFVFIEFYSVELYIIPCIQ